MKTGCILFFFYAFISIGWSTVWQGNYYIDSMADVLAFPTECNCTSIEGDLRITLNFEEDFTHLDSLYVLKEVSGSVLIIANHHLKNLGGLNNLVSIGKDLNITDNYKLTKMDAFSNLDTLGGTLNVVNNPKLSQIEGFEKLRHFKEVVF